MNGQVKSADVADDGLTGQDVAESSLALGASFTTVPDGVFHGSCAFEENGWMDYLPNANEELGYARDLSGFVHLRGFVVRCGEPSTGDVIFTLPDGFRPAKNAHLIASLNEGDKFSEILVRPSGEVEATQSATGDRVSLDGLTFRCAPSGETGCP